MGTIGKKNTVHAALRAAVRQALMDRMAQNSEADEDLANAMWNQSETASTPREADDR